jgi:hypothetical protein
MTKDGVTRSCHWCAASPFAAAPLHRRRISLGRLIPAHRRWWAASLNPITSIRGWYETALAAERLSTRNGSLRPHTASRQASAEALFYTHAPIRTPERFIPARFQPPVPTPVPTPACTSTRTTVSRPLNITISLWSAQKPRNRNTAVRPDRRSARNSPQCRRRRDTGFTQSHWDPTKRESRHFPRSDSRFRLWAEV